MLLGIMDDNQAGKGSSDSRSPNHEARRSSWDRIFGKKEKNSTKRPTLISHEEVEKIVDDFLEDDNI